MRKLLCSTFDSKSHLYSPPWVTINKETAIRQFANAVNATEQGLISMNPSDFTLFHMGYYDDDNGVITVIDASDAEFPGINGANLKGA